MSFDRRRVSLPLSACQASLSAALVESDALEKKYTIKRKALEMLPNAAESIKQLQSICAQSAQRLMQVRGASRASQSESERVRVSQSGSE